MTSLDPILQTAISRLAPKVPRALLVGGAVRDLLLGIPTKDADVEVYGIEPVALEAVLRKLFVQVDVVGASFGVYKVLLDEGRMLDVAIPRKESKTGRGHKGFEVVGDPNLSVDEALRRRDFTMNAIVLDVATKEIIDPYNGRADLAAKILRVVDQKTFIEDPLRVFRGVQFVARFGLKVEPETFELMRQMVERGDLDELSKERVTDEWKKLLVKAPRPSVGFELMRSLDIVPHYYPELAAMIGTPQEPDWHPEGDVWIHTLMAIDECARIVNAWDGNRTSETGVLTAMLGAVCHDIGKPLVTKTIDGKIRALGHEEAGVEPTKSFCRRFIFGDDVLRDVVAIVRDHLKPTTLYRSFQKGELDERKYANAVRRLLKRLGSCPLEVFLAVTEADTVGRGGLPLLTKEGVGGRSQASPLRAEYSAGAFMRSTVQKLNLEVAAKTPLITGAELIAAFGMTPGPKIGEVMKAVEAARDEGTLETPDDARVFVKQLVYTELK